MKKLFKILCVVSVFGAGLVVSVNAVLPKLGITSSYAELAYASENDKLLTYKVPVPPKQIFNSENIVGKKLTAAEFVQHYSNSTDPSIKRHLQNARNIRDHNKWLENTAGKLWYEAVRFGLQEPNSFDSKWVSDRICNSVKETWRNDAPARKYTYSEYVGRMKKQTDLMGVKLYTNAIIEAEYIDYYFSIKTKHKDVKQNLARNLSKYFRMLQEPDIEKIKLKIKDEAELKWVMEIHPIVQKHLDQYGIGKKEAPQGSSVSARYEYGSKDKTIFLIRFPASKSAFLNFDKNKELRIPPPYIDDLYRYALSKQKSAYIKLNNTRKRNQIPIEEIEAQYDYDFAFLKAKRSVEFSYRYRYPITSIRKDRTAWSVSYIGRGTYQKNNALTDIYAIVKCGMSGLGNPKELVNRTVSVKSPYLIKYPWRKVKRCRPYFTWLSCHARNEPAELCKNISKQEPEMCK